MILLTGATGMLGSHIAYELVSKGESIRALKRKNAGTNITEKIFSCYSKDPQALLKKIEWVEGDLLDIGSLENALYGIKKVYHAAALVTFDPKQKGKMLQVNIEGTANLVNSCLEEGIEKICHISSIAALGFTTESAVINENVWWKNDPSNSWYAISKYGAEREVWRGTVEGLDAVILNPSFIIGPGDTSKTSTEVFGALKKGNRWYTLGENGYVDARDVAAAAVSLMNSEIKNKRFILSAVNLTYRDFFDKILSSFGNKRTRTRVSKFGLAIGWRSEKMICALTGKTPRVTKETALTALQVNRYDGSLVTKTIDFRYRNFDESVKEITAFYR